jgi:hypothetical protein
MSMGPDQRESRTSDGRAISGMGGLVARCKTIVCLIMLPAMTLAAQVEQGPPPPQTESGFTATDRLLTRQVERALHGRQNILVRDLDVIVDTGIVTLHGTVATSAEKHLAARYAQDVRGVEGVVNAIVVNPARQPPG